MSESKVKRRQVFYIPGYDPFHPRRYRELYRREAKAQAQISGYDIDIKAKTGAGPYGWQVDSVQDNAQVFTEIDVLVWHDIVKNSMNTSLLATYFQLCSTAWVYLRSGALFRLMRLRAGPMIAALYPVIFLLVQLMIAIIVALSIYEAMSSIQSDTMTTRAVFGMLAIATGWCVLKGFQRLDRRIFAHYLMHDYAFTAQNGGEPPLALDKRLKEFAEIVETALDKDLDEVLIVGHSSGAHLGVSVIADLSRRQVSGFEKLAFLSLGQVIPMVSFLPKASDLRKDLFQLGIQDTVTWIDITAPGDGCCFALCDPVAVTGCATSETKQPLVLSAAFSQTLRPETWKRLKWRFFQVHFQYLCAFDRPGDYDYFRITAGPLKLADRFSKRTPSKKRIIKPVNTFRGRAQ